MNPRAGELVSRFLFDSAHRMPFRRLVGQNDFEFVNYFISSGVRRDISHQIPWYRNMIVSSIRDGSFRFFFNLNSWKKCLESVECSFSCRIHGSILALLCGIPAAIVPFESRTRELAEYHALPIIPPERISPGDTIEKFVDRFDFATMRHRHRENFFHFIDFLHRNGLKTVFDNGGIIRPGPGAGILAKDVPCETMKPLWDVSPAVRTWRNIQWKILWHYQQYRWHHPLGILVE